MEKIIISDGRITVIDESPREEARGIVFEAVNLSLVASESTMFSAIVEASGEIRQTHGSSEFFWDGHVEFSHSDSPQAVMRLADTSQILKMDGKLKVRDLDVRQVTEFFYFDSAATVDLGLTNLEGHMTLMPGQVGYEVNVSDLSLKSQVGFLYR